MKANEDITLTDYKFIFSPLRHNDEKRELGGSFAQPVLMISLFYYSNTINLQISVKVSFRSGREHKKKPSLKKKKPSIILSKRKKL